MRLSRFPPNPGDVPLYATPEELLRRQDCHHIVTIPTSSPVHLERVAAGLRATWPTRQRVALAPGSPAVPPGTLLIRWASKPFTPHSVVFSSLAAFYRDTRSWADAHPWEPLWHDISTYPPLPYDSRYYPLRPTIEFFTLKDEENVKHHGPLVVYGPVDLSPRVLDGGVLHPQEEWLIIAYPAIQRHVVRKTLVLGKGQQARDQHPSPTRQDLGEPVVEEVPGYLLVYGHPPAQWQAAETHHFPPERWQRPTRIFMAGGRYTRPFPLQQPPPSPDDLLADS